MLLLQLAILLLGTCLSADKQGFNNDLGWLDVDEFNGLDLAENDKPIMYQIYLKGCGACEALKKEMNKDNKHTKKIRELAPEFLMVLIEKGELAANQALLEQLKIDGQYFPRTYFAAPDGKVFADVKKDQPKHQFFLFPDEISKHMELTLEKPMPKKAQMFTPTEYEELTPEEEKKKARREAHARGERPKVVKDKSRGWNTDIAWISIEDAEAIRKKSTNEKPFLVLQHMEGCQACKLLKSEFTKSGSEDVKLALPVFEKFHMVNVLDAEEIPEEWEPEDGQYFPRVLFVSPEGKLIKSIKNLAMDKFPWYYPSLVQLHYSAERALHLLANNGDEESLQKFEFSRRDGIPKVWLDDEGSEDVGSGAASTDEEDPYEDPEDDDDEATASGSAGATTKNTEEVKDEPKGTEKSKGAAKAKKEVEEDPYEEVFLNIEDYEGYENYVDYDDYEDGDYDDYDDEDYDEENYGDDDYDYDDYDEDDYDKIEL